MLRPVRAFNGATLLQQLQRHLQLVLCELRRAAGVKLLVATQTCTRRYLTSPTTTQSVTSLVVSTGCD
jgi:hypothetical protein